MSTKSERIGRRLAVPATGITFGLVALLVEGSQGKWGLGATMLGIMVAYVAIVMIFGRFEPFAMLAEESGDERRRLIQLRAGYFTLNAVALFVIGGFLIDLLRGGDGQPWAMIGLVGGVSFIAALVVLSRRG
jgi:hypothetical protein